MFYQVRLLEKLRELLDVGAAALDNEFGNTAQISRKASISMHDNGLLEIFQENRVLLQIINIYTYICNQTFSKRLELKISHA